jgi:hypothetical protein
LTLSIAISNDIVCPEKRLPPTSLIDTSLAKAVRNEGYYKELSHSQEEQEVVQSMATEMLRLEPLDAKLPSVSIDPPVRDIQKAIIQLYRQSPRTVTVQGWLANQQSYRKSKERRRDRLFARLVMAFFGGFALIVPMLIMTLHPTRLTVLLTTSLCVIIVAVALAVYMENAEPKDVMAAVAAYAAVLVVFVGAGSGTGTS